MESVDEADALNLSIYKREYKRKSLQRGFEASLFAWTKLLQKFPLLYLPDRSPINDFDTRDYKRHLWTYQESNEAAKIVENRTSRVLQIQELLIIHWYESATTIQKIFRAYCARQEVARIRATLSEDETRRILSKRAVLTRLRRNCAARSIQRGYRCQHAYMKLQEKSRDLLQKAIRLFLFRLHRRHACITIQRAYRLMKFRGSIRTRLKMITSIVRKQQKQEKLEQLARDYIAARKQREGAHRKEILHDYPVESQRFLRVKQRKKNILKTLMIRRPPNDVSKAKSSKNRNQDHAHILPHLH